MRESVRRDALRHVRRWVMFARVSLFHESVDEGIRVTRERVVPVVLGLPGSRGGFFLVNREEDRTLSLTLWQSREALDASAAAIAQLRAERPQHVPGSELVDFGEYEVVLAPLSLDASAS
jgi:hypothetical protein